MRKFFAKGEKGRRARRQKNDVFDGRARGHGQISRNGGIGRDIDVDMHADTCVGAASKDKLIVGRNRCALPPRRMNDFALVDHKSGPPLKAFGIRGSESSLEFSPGRNAAVFRRDVNIGQPS